ncbi:MAG: serine/threonine protein kinase [Gemmatimonadota bacterium]|nr:MAG: serine/threonine protein kinase [Gemmatimonadota bacterium]
MADLLERLKAALADRYRIERELGSGGMATVYLAQDLRHERQVAVKVLRPELAAALGPERFHQEIKIAANLHHPHILPLYDSGDAEGFLYYVMPYEEGQSLRDKLAKEGELPISEAVRILRDVVDALSEAHDRGVVHRDIKPDNILLTKHHALVTDFGVAKAVSEATSALKLTTEGVALGTPAYMSPEQAAADKHIDHRADIYAVGVVAYELLTGRTPFLGTTPQMILSSHMTDTPEPVTKYRESVPPALAQLVTRCLEKKAADRWQSAEELLPQLEALATPSGGVTPTGTMPVDRRVKRRWMMAGATVGVAAIVAVIGVIAALLRGGGVALDPNHVAVAVFRNATGDQSLDQVGERVAHWITQGLQQAAIQVTPWDGTLQAWQYVQSEADAGRVRDLVRALAEETSAGTVVSGVVYLENDSLEIHVHVTDARRSRPLGTIDPVKGPQEATSEIIADMQQRVMGFLAINLDERISDQASSRARPPSLEAYQEFDRGWELFLRDAFDDRAKSHFYRAFELDTTFVIPLRYAVLINFNQGRMLGWWDSWAQADSLLRILERFEGRLSQYDQHWLHYLKARMAGDNPEALRAIRRAAELAPGSRAVYNRAFIANRVNRPQEAVDALLSLDPERGPMRGWSGYFDELMHAYLALDQHEKALEVAQRSRETFGDIPWMLGYEGLALAGLGRIKEVNVLLDDLVNLPEEGLTQGYWIVTIAAFLRLHAHIGPARSTIERAITWYEARLPETKSSAEWRLDYASALYTADRCDQAYGVAKPVSDEFPEELDYRGLVGVLAACRGDEDEALRLSQWLGALDRPYLKGNHTAWRSQIAGALGDGESAVALWRQALAEGVTPRFPSTWRTAWLAFEPIRDYPPFQELMRPKG